MPIPADRWTVVRPSAHPWEQEALDYLRAALPGDEGWYGWSNFEFLSPNGAIYEVDAVVLSPVEWVFFLGPFLALVRSLRTEGEWMKKVRFSDEKIVEIVRESRAHGVPEAAKKYQVSEQSIYSWRRRFGTMETNQVSELKKVQQENAKLKKLLAERDLEIDVMKETLSKKW